MREEIQQSFWARCQDMPPRDRRNIVRWLLTLALWAVCFTGATQLIRHQLLPAGPISWAVAVFPSIVALIALFAYVRYLREADELQRTIQLQALAWGFGAGWLAICGYPLFERLGAPVADVSDYLMVMIVCYSLVAVLGERHYR